MLQKKLMTTKHSFDCRIYTFLGVRLGGLNVLLMLDPIHQLKMNLETKLQMSLWLTGCLSQMKSLSKSKPSVGYHVKTDKVTFDIAEI